MWSSGKEAHLLLSLLLIGVFTTSQVPTGAVSVCLVQVVREPRKGGWRAPRLKVERSSERLEDEMRG